MSTLKVAVLGAGGTIAPAIVRDLAESDEAAELLLLDLDGERARAVADEHGGGKARAQAVDARGVAKEVIRRMGLDAVVRAACTDTAGAYAVDAEGNVLETFRAEDNDGDGYISEIEILRGDFSQLLYDDTRDGVEYVFGDRIAELAQDEHGVDVTFASDDRRR